MQENIHTAHAATDTYTPYQCDILSSMSRYLNFDERITQIP